MTLIDRATGGEPQDPVSVLEQHVKVQKVIERQGDQRNAGLLRPATSEQAENGQPSWMATTTAIDTLTSGLIGSVQAATQPGVVVDVPQPSHRLDRVLRLFPENPFRTHRVLQTPE